MKTKYVMISILFLVGNLIPARLFCSAAATPAPVSSAIKSLVTVGQEKEAAADVKSLAAQDQQIRNFLCTIDHKDEALTIDYRPANFNDALTSDLIVAIAQQAAPILLFGTHLLHNNIKRSHEGRNYVTEEVVTAVANAQQLLAKTKGVATPDNVKLVKEAFGKTHSMIGFVEFHIMAKFPERWLLFEYVHKSPEHTHAYLLLPKRLAGNISPTKAIELCGFKAQHFVERSLADLKKKVIDAREWSAPCAECLQLSEPVFEQGVVNFFKHELLPPSEKFGVALHGHGLHYVPEADEKEAKGKQNTIAGLSIPKCMELLAALSNKGAELVHFNTCFLGGMNLKTLRQNLFDFEKRIPSSNKMIVASSATTDAPVTVLNKRLLHHIPDAIFTKLLPRLADSSYLESGLLPDFPAIQFDLYFKELAQLQRYARLNAKVAVSGSRSIYELLRGMPLRSIPQQLATMLKQLSGYDVRRDSYELSAVTQIRLPDYDGVFRAVELTDKVKVLTYLDVYKPQLEVELQPLFRSVQAREVQAAQKIINELFERIEKKEAPSKEDIQRLKKAYDLSIKKGEQLRELAKPLVPAIVITNKELVMVYPPAVNVPVTITGKNPIFIPMLGGTTPLAFKEIQAAQIPLHKMLRSFVFQGVYTRRYFVEKLVCNDLQVNGLYVESEAEARFGLQLKEFQAFYFAKGNFYTLRKGFTSKIESGAFEKVDDPKIIMEYRRKVDQLLSEVAAKGGVVSYMTEANAKAESD